MRLKRYLCLLLAVLLFIPGCGGPDTAPAETPPVPDRTTPAATEAESTTETTIADDTVPYAAPPFLEACYHEDMAEGTDTAKIDISAVSDGYVAASAFSEKRLKFQVVKEDIKYTYDLAGDGTPSVFPLQSGDGLYLFRVLENTSESKYAVRYSTECEVVIPDEFSPYLRPSDYVNYSQSSECVKLAAELAAEAEDKLEIVTSIYSYITSHIKYDMEKARTVEIGYLPTPDETLSTGKGICFDYASLAASMLRSQGIPTKLVFGYVSPGDVYHAWNMFYTETTGWVAVKIEVTGDTWVRLDATFAASGSSPEFIGDGSNYSDVRFF